VLTDLPGALSPTASYLVETFVTLVVVCGLAFVVLYGARRMGIGRARGPIELVGQLPLDARRSIYLVRVGGEGGQVLVVGVGEGGFTKLGEVAASALPATLVPEPAAFADVFARVLGPKKEDKS
jgi:flagellar biogenesis protein FliO